MDLDNISNKSDNLNWGLNSFKQPGQKIYRPIFSIVIATRTT